MRYQDCAEAGASGTTALLRRRPRDANINPATGLSTDYLNHFNEAIMLLEMLRDAPDCRDDFLAWRAKSYREHFAASRLRSRDTAIAAYDAADAHARESLDALAGTMTIDAGGDQRDAMSAACARHRRHARRARRRLPQAAGRARRRGHQRRRPRDKPRGAASDGRRPDEPLELEPVEARTYPTGRFSPSAPPSSATARCWWCGARASRRCISTPCRAAWSKPARRLTKR